MGLIDVHGHVVLEDSLGAAGHVCGPEIGTYPDGSSFFRVGDWRLDGVPYRGSLFMEAQLRLDAMDTAGIDLQVLSPNPLSYLHHIDAPNAIDYCRKHNDALADVVAAHPGRLLGFASLPMQDVEAAITELQRSVTQLGLLGGYVGSDFATNLDDPRMDPFYDACVQLDVPFFIHPAPSGLDGPLRDPRMRRWDLDLVVEFSYEEMMSVAALVFGGVTRRHPALDVCISHGGGSTPMHLAKLRKLAERRPSMPEWIREPGAFADAFGRLWFDCHVTGDAEFAFAVDQLGTDRLVFGTNFGGWDSPKDPSEMSHLEYLIPTLNANAKRLLRLPD